MSDNNFFTDFTENLGFDNSLSQTGVNGYLQNEKALEYFRKKISDWNNIFTTASSAAAVGLLGMPIITLIEAVGALISNELSISIARIVPVMEMLLTEFQNEEITITPNVKTEEGTIDLLVRTADGRYFALMLRSNGESKVRWREDRQEFIAVRKSGRPKWSGLKLLGERLNSDILYLKEEKNPLFGTSNTERKKGCIKAIVLTANTTIDPNNNPEHLVTFGRTRALKIGGTTTYFLVERAHLADFIRKPREKPIDMSSHRA